jgi:hypothetical protein
LAHSEPSTSSVSFTTCSIGITASGKASGADFLAAAAAEAIQPKEPCYLLIRNTADGGDPTKFVFVYCVPSNSRVHDKMLYSSTLNTVKLALNAVFFSAELHVESAAECAAARLSAHTHSRKEMMTVNELLAHESAYESAQGIATEAKVSVDLPVKVSTDVLPAIAALKDGSVAAVVFTLNAETETLELVSKGPETIDQTAATFTREAPRYCVFNHAHTNPNTGAAETAVVFVYYCPDKARPRLKMFFSAAKSLVVRVVEEQGVTIRKSFEATEASEVSGANALTYLYPAAVEKKVINKPKPPSRAGKAAFTGKFEDF